MEEAGEEKKREGNNEVFNGDAVIPAYAYIYIYIFIYMCVCMCGCVPETQDALSVLTGLYKFA